MRWARGAPRSAARRRAGRGQGRVRRRRLPDDVRHHVPRQDSRRRPTRWRWRGCARPARSSSARRNMPELGLQSVGDQPVARHRAQSVRSGARHRRLVVGLGRVRSGMGLVPIALGTDGGGSVRIPAAHNGVVGLKGTFGRVPTEGVPATATGRSSTPGRWRRPSSDTLLAFGVMTDERLALPELPRPLRIGIATAGGSGPTARWRRSCARRRSASSAGRCRHRPAAHRAVAARRRGHVHRRGGGGDGGGAQSRRAVGAGDAHRLRDGARHERGRVRAGAAGARAHGARLRVGLGQRRRHRHADDGDDGAADPGRRRRRRARRGQDQPRGHVHLRVEPVGHAGGVGAVRLRRGGDAGGDADHRAARRGPARARRGARRRSR